MVMADTAPMVIYKPTDSDLALIKQLCMPDKIVSQNLGILPGAVSMRITRLSIKLGVENRTAIVVRALGLGWLTIDQLAYRIYNGETNVH